MDAHSTSTTTESLHAPTLRLDLTAIVAELHQEEPWRLRGHNARTIAKYPDLRVVLVAMQPQSRLHEHRTDARITIHVLTGRIRVRVENGDDELSPGNLLVVDRSLLHEVEAIEESVFLLTLAWPH